MTREEVPGSSLVLCLGPGPSSLLHLTRANAEKPYAGDTGGIGIKGGGEGEGEREVKVGEKERRW